jgi:hypothetical protein
MTIKQQGGIFGRNPTFNNVTIDGTLTTAGSFTPTGGIDVDGSDITIESGDLDIREYASNPLVSLRRAQGTQDTPTSIANGQTLAEIRFDGYTGSAYRRGATINAKVSAGVSGDEIPTTLRFYTTEDGNNSPTHQWSIDHNGNLVAVQAGNGIDFSATSGTGTSELFDDYEEGTWTPVVADAESGGNNCTMSAEPFTFGRYTKIGRLVHIEGSIRISGVSGVTTSNSAYITGLPFAPNSTGSGLKGGCVVRAGHVDTPANCVNLGVSARSTSTLTINTSIDAASSTTLTVANIQSTNANHYVSFNVSYYV